MHSKCLRSSLSIVLVLGLSAACSQLGPADTAPPEAAPVAGEEAAAAGASRVGVAPADNVPDAPSWAPVVFYEQIESSPIDLADLSDKSFDDVQLLAKPRKAGNQIEMPISEEEAERLRQEALSLPPDFNVQDVSALLPTKAPAVGAGFASIDAGQCCGGLFTAVPPDPEMAAGPRHLITVTNVAFAIYDRLGTQLVPPTPFGTFFAGVPGCSNNNSNFDPNVIYDERFNRFILGIDDGGVRYCIAATQGPDPTGTWNRYSFATNVGGNFFDYPHAGVGINAIFMGANMFLQAGPFFEGRLWAVRKRELYAGAPILVVSQSTGNDSTPQPANLHGFHQGTFPTSGPHHVLTDDVFNGQTYGVWSWANPFNGAGGTLVNLGTVNLFTATGVFPGFPINAPQLGGGAIQANDWRVQDAEYRNGSLWMSNTISCNPGGGTVDCVRWARIDPTVPSVLDAGVFASTGEFRTFADLAANHCDDMAVGYTKTGSTHFPDVWATGRQSGDPAGTLQAEALLKSGEITYTAFDPVPRRWGDYTGMTPHPNGVTYYYLGEYSKNIPGNARWGTWVNPMRYPCTTPNSVGVYTPATASFLLTTSLRNPGKDIAFTLGAANLQPVYGDWDGNDIRSGGVYDAATATFLLSDEVTTGGLPQTTFSFGTAGGGQVPVAGDWNGDGVDSIGLYDPSTGVFTLRDTNAAGPPDYTFSIVLTTVTANFPPAAGDWDGDGADGVALWDPSTTLWYLKNAPATGPADLTVQFGKPSPLFRPIGGDWDADGVDTIGLYFQPEARFFLKDANVSGNTGYQTVAFGATAADLPVVK
ncbi:MAG TPA: hypothetical protein VGG06_23570 [Thermoanaerobaculia bacterium]